MKHIFTLIAILSTAYAHVPVHAGGKNAADTLYLRNREKKVVEIREVYPDQVKYKSANGKNLISLPIKDIAEIVYNNGVRDFFNPFNAGGKPEIKWLTDVSYTDKPDLRLNACIVNVAEKVQVEVNGTLTSVATRSFKTLPAKDAGCIGGVSIFQQVILKEGKNTVRLIASNGSGSATSETLSILYEKAKKRIALVIGNSKYQSASKLQNPENDAKAISQKLTNLGFTVIERIDAKQGDLRAAVAQFGSSIQSQDFEVALFYYAGHGIQVAGKNYLMPVDISPQSEMELKVLAVSADEILDQMSAVEESSQRTNIMILDACRDNPLSRSWTRSSGSKGLASMSAPPGTLITFSTKPGSTAQDGDGKNSPYTSELLKALDVPDLRLEDIFRTVRVRVMELTKRQQIPMENSLLTRELILNRTK
ncbi:caspase domain-containing protein [Dyadobacter sp. CY261]|uniref:caspase family protein n=1 Tax=Dyadobacter sp. CY261 TaxID=2907203 RepID=UPI001F41C1BB|nr:caspase domain-containing protein [Dyadobacter sp. CY261]MCF0069402.1 caspase domain-containing protein [Dyadobacter sp. CY261]